MPSEEGQLTAKGSVSEKNNEIYIKVSHCNFTPSLLTHSSVMPSGLKSSVEKTKTCLRDK